MAESKDIEPRARDPRRELLTRREAIERVSLLLGGAALVGQSAMLAGCAATGTGDPPRASASASSGGLFTADEIALLDEVADTILPETSTPGAKAAEVGPFIALMVTDTYSERDQRVFKDGLAALDDECRRLHGTAFVAAGPAQRLALLEGLDEEQVAYMRARGDGMPAHYFRMIKELTLLGYFTSEIGYTQAMRYAESPGRFEACAPHAPGEKSWAPHA